MKLKKIPSLEGELANVIIETPRGSLNKFAYDRELQVFRLKKQLPLGCTFPFDFGFIPGTLGEDGDPLDVLVIANGYTLPGCLLQCRIAGILEAEQTEEDGKKLRNDRLIGISNASRMYENITNIAGLDKSLLSDIENFFVNYNMQEGRKFTPLGWGDAEKGLKIIRKYIQSE